MPDKPRAERLAELERDHAELIASLPAHSIPAALLLRIEEIEDEITALRAEAARAQGDESHRPKER